MIFLVSCKYFKVILKKNSFWNTIRVSNSCLDPVQARYFVGPELGLTCLLGQKSPGAICGHKQGKVNSTDKLEKALESASLAKAFTACTHNIWKNLC